MSGEPRTARRAFPLVVLAGLALVAGGALFVHTPDRPVETIAPGSSDGPTFVVQLIRPRAGLPLGGVAPPGWFGVDERLVFDSRGADDARARASAERVELEAGGLRLTLERDAQGHVTGASEVEFELVFEERPRRVRARLRDPLVGELQLVALREGAELCGSFDLELGPCEDAATGAPLGWPPRPLRLRGSFDRLPLEP